MSSEVQAKWKNSLIFQALFPLIFFFLKIFNRLDVVVRCAFDLLDSFCIANFRGSNQPVE